MVRPMVHSTKHYVQWTIGTTAAASITTNSISLAVAVVDKNATHEVEEGNSIKAVYLELWIRSAATAASSFVFTVMKRQAGLGAPDTTDLNALGQYDNKKNVFYTTQGLTNDVDSTALSLFKGWIKIPKSKQRQGLGDVLSWHLEAIGQSINFCGFSTYKEYS